MKKSTILAIDLAKNSFQVCKQKPNGQVVFNKPMSRSALIKLLATHPSAVVAMEACGGSHYWARLAEKYQHTVKAMAPIAVKGFQLKQKTDRNDALAIAIASQQEHIRAGIILSAEEQGLQALQRARQLQVEQRLALTNQIRGLLLEFGIAIPQGLNKLMQALPDILEDAENDLPTNFREVLHAQLTSLRFFNEQVEQYETLQKQQVELNSICQKLIKLEGVGPTAAVGLLIRLGNGSAFKNGRDASACVGVTPKQHSTGGKERIGHIAKNCADKRLRSVLFQGAMSVVYRIVDKEPTTLKEQWLKALVERRGKKIATFALVNKTIRTALALIKNDSEYQTVKLVA